MPRIFRPQYTRAIPAGAIACIHENQPAVKWRGRRGKWVIGIVCANPARCRVETARYRLEFRDHEYRRTQKQGYTDRTASEHLLNSLTTQAARIHSGQLPPQAARPRLTLPDLLAKWKQYMLDNGTSAAGARDLTQRARDVCEGAQAQRVSDLNPAAVLEWVGARRRANHHRRGGFGALTASNYIGAVKGFTRWCAVIERSEPHDHLSGLRYQRDESDPRRPRRALSESELRLFLRTVRRSQAIVSGLTGRERWALYLFACSTGLRAIELSRLTAAQISVSRAEVTIERGAKSKRRDVLPIPPDALRAVKPLLRGMGPLWPNRVGRAAAWWLWGARMVRADLSEAGIPARDGGLVYDLHALRGQYATDLDRAGVSLVRAQKLMRHSSPTLTAKFYTRPDAGELAVEVAKLKRGRS
jgi:site-specific recombinase XerD